MSRDHEARRRRSVLAGWQNDSFCTLPMEDRCLIFSKTDKFVQTDHQDKIREVLLRRGGNLFHQIYYAHCLRNVQINIDL